MKVFTLRHSGCTFDGAPDTLDVPDRIRGVISFVGGPTMAQKMQGPVELTDPTADPPAPVPGCDVCGALARQWAQAMEVGSPAYDPSHASDLAVEITRHPHSKRRPS